MPTRSVTVMPRRVFGHTSYEVTVWIGEGEHMYGETLEVSGHRAKEAAELWAEHLRNEQPRFEAVDVRQESITHIPHNIWIVVDHQSQPDDGFPNRVATFVGLDAERYAREHAERLNREVGQ